MNDPLCGGQAPILIIDDDEIVSASLCIALSDDYDVHVCLDAPSGVQQARTLRPAVIILDIKMSGHDGFWAFREIRRFDRAVPIVFNSAYQDVVPPSELREGYAPFACLTKSGGLKTLLSVVADAVQSNASR